MEIDLHQAKAQFSRLIERTMAGEEITILHAGRAVVRMVPVHPTSEQDVAENEIADLFADALGG